MATINDFKTPANERSFSALIDRALLETGRPAALMSAVPYANLTIREIQALGLFTKDLREDEIVTTASPHIFTRPSYWRSLAAVKYQSQDEFIFLRRPGRSQEGKTNYFYAADNYYVFNGNISGEVIGYAAYYYSKPLLYFGRLGVDTSSFSGGTYTTRPAYFDVYTDTWMYLNALGTAYVDDLGDDAEEELRRINTTMWILDDWFDTVLEGVKAKIFKQFGDKDRGGLSFSLYESNKQLIRTAESFGAEAGALPIGDN